MSILSRGRTIAVRADAVTALGATRAVVFQQLYYFGHNERNSDPDGWVGASLAEWSTFTGLSVDAVGRALGSLVESGHAEVVGEDRRPKKWRVAAAHLPRDRGTDDRSVPRDRSTTAAESRQALLLEIDERFPSGTNAGATLVVVDAFDRFWSTYPRKVGKTGKGGAEGAFRSALKRADAETIIAGAERYRDDPNRVDQFTKGPAAWLNQSCWNDPPLPDRNGRRRSESGNPLEDAAQAMMRRHGITTNGSDR